MDRITIKDKTFKPFLTREEIQARIKALARILNQEYADKRPLLIPVLNGAFIFAADLVRQLTIFPEIKFIRISTYGDTMSSSQTAQLLLGLEIDVDDRDVIILEDIVDTGYTSHFFMNYLREQKPRSVRLCTLLFKPDSFKMGRRPDYIGFEIPTKFVVGYGLDYAQQGRELEAIYQLAE
jgi:hypoxanthine phosphoribosyltransferase